MAAPLLSGEVPQPQRAPGHGSSSPTPTTSQGSLETTGITITWSPAWSLPNREMSSIWRDDTTPTVSGPVTKTEVTSLATFLFDRKSGTSLPSTSQSHWLGPCQSPKLGMHRTPLWKNRFHLFYMYTYHGPHRGSENRWTFRSTSTLWNTTFYHRVAGLFFL